MSADWIVLKFGGTSVAGRAQWETIARLVEERRASGLRVLLVCSAVSGMTNLLQKLAENPNRQDALEKLLSFHASLAAELEIDAEDLLDNARTQLEETLINMARDPGPRHRAALMAIGEWLSTQMGARFLAMSIEVEWVDAREALEVIEEINLSPARRWLSASCAAGADEELIESWSERAPVLITQGFIARVEDGSTALLGRGGSDTSAALLAGRLKARKLEIWTDVPGLFTADPRLVPEARLLNRVDYAEALEMAAGGAKVVHPRCIRAAAETQTPLVIRDIHRLRVEGTLIDDAAPAEEGVRTITSKHHMTVLLLHNLDARHEVGFLAAVFEVFRRLGISVDQVATSETTTTLAFCMESNHLDARGLDRLVTDLSEHCRVKVFENCASINFVGRGARTSLDGISSALELFKQHPLLMASQSANDLCLSLLVEEGVHDELMRRAHRALVPPAPDGATRFGACWDSIRAG